MSYMMKDLKITTNSSEDTEKIAEQIGNALRGGEIIELIGDLGSGKTTFVRGLARGMGSTDNVASPTFTINRIYQSEKLTLNHFDFYRLDEPGLMANELSELINDPSSVLAIEWPGITERLLPDIRLAVKFFTKAENIRELEISYPTELQYLIKEHTK